MILFVIRENGAGFELRRDPSSEAATQNSLEAILSRSFAAKTYTTANCSTLNATGRSQKNSVNPLTSLFTPMRPSCA